MPKTLKKLRTAQIPSHLSDSRKQEGHEKVVRKYDRELLRIPVSLQLQDKSVSGFSHDFSPAGLRIILQTALKTGTPLALQCIRLVCANQGLVCANSQDYPALMYPFRKDHRLGFLSPAHRNNE